MHQLFIESERIIVPAGEIIIKQGDDARYFYIIESGEVEFYRAVDKQVQYLINSIEIEGGNNEQNKFASTNRQDYKSIKKGSFGEIALMYNVPRSASAIAVEDTVLVRLYKDSFIPFCRSGGGTKGGSVVGVGKNTDDSSTAPLTSGSGSSGSSPNVIDVTGSVIDEVDAERVVKSPSVAQARAVALGMNTIHILLFTLQHSHLIYLLNVYIFKNTELFDSTS